MDNSLTIQSRNLIEKLTARKIIKNNEKIEKSNNENSLIPDALLYSSNNLRQNKGDKILDRHDISDSFPKSSITSILSRSAYLSKSMPKRMPFGVFNTINQSNKDPLHSTDMKITDLLGYDWIVGMMENKSKESQLDKPVEYFEELDRFRRKNKQFCISSDNRELFQSDTILNNKDYQKVFGSFNSDIHSSRIDQIYQTPEEQPRVYAYTLNERLFPVPLDLETAERGIADPNNPHIIKVSIPSNRFMYRNQPFQQIKEKSPLVAQPNSELKNIGESLSLSSHCLHSIKNMLPVSQSDKHARKLNSVRQEPAGLMGNLISQTPDFVGKLHENVLPFGDIQPKTEKEAIDQLKRGKIGAKLGRSIPSSLENRNLNLDSNSTPMNICETRIALKDMIDESNPRTFRRFVSEIDKKPPLCDNFDPSVSVPRVCVSRKDMSKVYTDAIETVRNGTI